jgi:hypothetical protein
VLLNLASLLEFAYYIFMKMQSNFIALFFINICFPRSFSDFLIVDIVRLLEVDSKI